MKKKTLKTVKVIFRLTSEMRQQIDLITEVNRLNISALMRWLVEKEYRKMFPGRSPGVDSKNLFVEMDKELPAFA